MLSIVQRAATVAARGTIASIVHTSTCAASVLQSYKLRNSWLPAQICIVSLAYLPTMIVMQLQDLLRYYYACIRYV